MKPSGGQELHFIQIQYYYQASRGKKRPNCFLKNDPSSRKTFATHLHSARACHRLKNLPTNLQHRYAPYTTVPPPKRCNAFRLTLSSPLSWLRAVVTARTRPRTAFCSLIHFLWGTQKGKGKCERIGFRDHPQKEFMLAPKEALAFDLILAPLLSKAEVKDTVRCEPCSKGR